MIFTGTFYYGWYGNPSGPTGEWAHWDPTRPNYDSAYKPRLGYYDSQSPIIVERHLLQMMQAKFDVAIHSWWGPADQTDKVLDQHIAVIDGAYSSAPEIQVAALIETVASEADFTDAIVHLVKKARASKLAWFNYPAPQPKPLILVWANVMDTLTPAQCSSAIKKARTLGYDPFILVDNPSFRGPTYYAAGEWDGIFDYGGALGLDPKDIEEVVKGWTDAQSTILNPNHAFAPSVAPGWKFSRPPIPPETSKDQPRYDGGHLSFYYMKALSYDPEFILVTSWNEFHEGTNVEPDATNGDLYLNLLALYNDYAHGL